MAAQSTHPEGSRLRGLMAACQSVIEISPLPMALIEGFDAVLRCINPAFCNLAGERMQDLLGRRASVAVPVGKEFLRDLRETLVSGESCTRVGDRSGDHSSLFNAYAMWPVLGPGNSATAVMIQIIDSGHARDGVDGNRTIRADTSRQKRMAEGLEERLSAEVEEKKKALEALVQSEKLASLGRMAASIAHEINNPLETVTNLIYLTRSIPDLPENARQFLDIADSELTRIAEITRQSLGFYRESAIPETFSLALLLDSVGHLLVSRIKSSHATVACEADENLRITAHSGEMRQVLSNLLLNSLDAVGVGGRVRLRARLHLDSVSRLPFVRITISDNGAGIDATALPHIFEPFFTTKGSAGNGLGLWVSREIVRKNGGWMRVRSATNGARKGTTFSVVMPAIPN